VETPARGKQCVDGRERVEKIWNEDAANELGRVLVQRGEAVASEWPYLRGELDRWAANWIRVDDELCERYGKSGAPAQQLDCLDRQLLQLETTVEVLATITEAEVMRTTELLVGKTIPYLVISLLAMTIVLFAARVLFGLRVTGSYVQLYAVSLLFLTGALSFGLLISTLVDRQQDAFQIAGLRSMLPTVLLSGFIFPIRSMPWPMQALSHVVPARYFIRILRGVILKGAPASNYPADLLALVLYAALALGLASTRLARRRT
jgi:uncharacterized phage infection (PIP) family protein YhgE